MAATRKNFAANFKARTQRAYNTAGAEARKAVIKEENPGGSSIDQALAMCADWCAQEGVTMTEVDDLSREYTAYSVISGSDEFLSLEDIAEEFLSQKRSK